MKRHNHSIVRTLLLQVTEPLAICSRRLSDDFLRWASLLLLAIHEYRSAARLAQLGTRRKNSVRKSFGALTTVLALALGTMPAARAVAAFGAQDARVEATNPNVPEATALHVRAHLDVVPTRTVRDRNDRTRSWERSSWPALLSWAGTSTANVLPADTRFTKLDLRDERSRSSRYVRLARAREPPRG